MTNFSYDSSGAPQPYYDVAPPGQLLPATPLAGLLDPTVADSTALPDPLTPFGDPNLAGTPTSGSLGTAAPLTPFGALPAAPSVSAPNSAGQIVNQMFTPQAAQAAAAQQGGWQLTPQQQANLPPPPSAGQAPTDNSGPLGQFQNWEKQNLPDWASTLANSAIQSVVPGAAAFGTQGLAQAAVGAGGRALGVGLTSAALEAGAVAGGEAAGVGALAGLGLADWITVPLFGIAGFIGGTIAAMGAAALVDQAQSKVLSSLVGDSQWNQWQTQRAAQDKANPIASMVGQFTGMGMFMTPSVKGLMDASKLVGLFRTEGPSVFTNKDYQPLVEALTNVTLGAGTQAALTGYQQIQAGKLDVGSLLASSLGGALLNHQTGLGDRIAGLGPRLFKDPALQDEAAAQAKAKALTDDVNSNVQKALASEADGAGEAKQSVTPQFDAQLHDLTQNLNAKMAEWETAKRAGNTDLAERLNYSVGDLQVKQQALETEILARGGTLPESPHPVVPPADANVVAASARESAQVPHAMENGHTLLQPGEYYAAVPNVNLAVNQQKLNLQRTSETKQTTGSLLMTEHPEIAQMHADVLKRQATEQGSNIQPGVVVVRMKDGAQTISQGSKLNNTGSVMGRHNEVQSVRKLRPLAETQAATGRGMPVQGRTTVNQPGVIMPPKVLPAAPPSDLHIMPIDTTPENLATLHGETQALAEALPGGSYGNAPELTSLGYMRNALDDARDAGDSVVVARNVDNKLTAVASYHMMPFEVGGIGKAIEVVHLGSAQPGSKAGTRLMAEIARTAVSHNAGLFVHAGPGAHSYYESLGMERYSQNEFAMTPKDTRDFVHRVDEVTNRDGSVREVPPTKEDLLKRYYTVDAQGKLVDKLVESGAERVPAEAVTHGWIMESGQGVNLRVGKKANGDYMIHDTLVTGRENNSKKMPFNTAPERRQLLVQAGLKFDQNFTLHTSIDHLVNEGAIRVARAGSIHTPEGGVRPTNISYSVGAVPTNDTLMRIESNLIHADLPGDTVVQINNREKLYSFNVNDFKRNGMDLPKTMADADRHARFFNMESNISELRTPSAVPEAVRGEDVAPDPAVMQYILSEMRTGEGKAAAGMNTDLIKALGKGSYDGDTGKTVVKEAVQNAVDSVRDLPGGGGHIQVDVHFPDRTKGASAQWDNALTQQYYGDLNPLKNLLLSSGMSQNEVDRAEVDGTLRQLGEAKAQAVTDDQGRGVTVTDNGIGMVPDVATAQLLDPGGSLKGEGASGGYGMAKIVMFMGAKNIDIVTVARDPNHKGAYLEAAPPVKDPTEKLRQLLMYAFGTDMPGAANSRHSDADIISMAEESIGTPRPGDDPNGYISPEHHAEWEAAIAEARAGLAAKEVVKSPASTDASPLDWKSQLAAHKAEIEGFKKSMKDFPEPTYDETGWQGEHKAGLKEAHRIEDRLKDMGIDTNEIEEALSTWENDVLRSDFEKGTEGRDEFAGEMNSARDSVMEALESAFDEEPPAPTHVASVRPTAAPVTAAEPVASGLIMTHITGTGDDWLASEGRAMNVQEVHNATPEQIMAASKGGLSATGTRMDITFGDDTRAEPHQSRAYMDRLQNTLATPIKLSYSENGREVRSTSDLATKDMVAGKKIVTNGANVDVWTSKDSQKTNGVDVSILNNGIHQFDLYIPLGGDGEMPNRIIMDVHAKGTPQGDDYPFMPSRQTLKDDVQKPIEDYVKIKLGQEALEREKTSIMKAFQDSPLVKDTKKFRVVDLNGGVPPEIVRDVADLPGMASFLQRASATLDRLKAPLTEGAWGDRFDNATLHGLSLSDEHFGVNIHKGATGTDTNPILINPFVTMEHVMSLVHWYEPEGSGDPEWHAMRDTLVKRFASSIIATLEHEIVHEVDRGDHRESFSSIHTRNKSMTIDESKVSLMALEKVLKDNDYEIINSIQAGAKLLEGRTGRNEIFKHATDAFTATGQDDTVDPTLARGSAEGGAGLAGNVRRSGAVNAAQMARSAVNRGSQSGLDQNIRLYHGTTQAEKIVKEGVQGQDLHKLTNGVEVALGLDPDTLWSHAGLDYLRAAHESKNTRETAAHVTTDHKLAAEYAQRGGAALSEDILPTAWRLTHNNQRSTLHPEEYKKWEQEILDQMGLKPSVVAIDMPFRELLSRNGTLQRVISSWTPEDIARFTAPRNLPDLSIRGGITPDRIKGVVPAEHSASLVQMSPRRPPLRQPPGNIGSTPEEFGRTHYFHGTDAKGVAEINQTGILREGSSVSPYISVSHGFAANTGAKLTGGWNSGGGSVFAVARHALEDAEIDKILKRADTLKASKGMTEEEAIQQAFDENERDVFQNDSERTIGAPVKVAHEIPHERAATLEDAHKYLQELEAARLGVSHGIQQEATRNSQEGRSPKPSLETLEANAFGHARKGQVVTRVDGQAAGPRAAEAGTGTQAEDATLGRGSGSGAAADATNAYPGYDVATGRGTGSGAATDAGGTGDGTANGGRPTAGGTTTDAGDGSGTTTGPAGGPVSDAGARAAGSAGLGGAPDDTSGSRAGGVYSSPAQLNDAAARRPQEAAAGPAGNGRADAGSPADAQLGTQAGLAGGTASQHPVTVKGGDSRTQAVVNQALSIVDAAGLNSNGLINEVHIVPGGGQFYGIYNPNFRHSVAVDAKMILTDKLHYEAEQLKATLQHFNAFPRDPDVLHLRPQFEEAMKGMWNAVEKMAVMDDAHITAGVVGHEVIHPQIVEALRRSHEQELIRQDPARYHPNYKLPVVQPKNMREDELHRYWAESAYRQARYLPKELLDNMARTGGLSEEVEVVRAFHDWIDKSFSGRVPHRIPLPEFKATNFDAQTLAWASHYIDEHLNYLIMDDKIGDGYSHATPDTTSASVWNVKEHQEAKEQAAGWLAETRSPATEAPYLHSRATDPTRFASSGRARFEDYERAANWDRDAAAANKASIEAGKPPLANASRFAELVKAQDELQEYLAKASWDSSNPNELALDIPLSLSKVVRMPSEPIDAYNERAKMRVLTAKAVRETKRVEGESDVAYGQRLAVAANYESLDHAVQIRGFAKTGDYMYPSVERNGQIYVKLGNKEYRGTPTDQVKGWNPKFDELIQSQQGRVVAESNLKEPPVDNGYLNFHGDDIHADFAKASATGLKGAQADAAARAKLAKNKIPTSPDPITPEQISAIHVRTNANMEAGLFGSTLAADEGVWGPGDISAFSKAANTIAAKEAAAGGTPPPIEPPTGQGPDATGEPVPEVPKGTASDPQELADRGMIPGGLIPGIHYDPDQKAILATRMKWGDFTQAVNDALKLPEVAPLAQDFHDILINMAGRYEFDMLSANPEVYADRMTFLKNEMNARAQEAGIKLGKLLGPDLAVHKLIAKAIETDDYTGLDPIQMAFAKLQHHYYDVTGDMAERVGMIKSAVDLFLPHMIKVKEGGRGAGTSMAKGSVHQIGRVQIDDAEGGGAKALFDTLDKYEAGMVAAGHGTEVERDLSKTFVAHASSWNNALVMNNFIKKGMSDLQMPQRTGHTYTGNIILSPENWSKLKSRDRDMANELRVVNKGPFEKALAGKYVVKEMAERMERLAGIDEMTVPLSGLARNVVKMNGWFKEIKFIGPMHIMSMMSDVASLTSKKGYFGLPPMADGTVLKTVGRGADILGQHEEMLSKPFGKADTVAPGDKSRYYRGLASGLPATGASGEKMAEAMGVMEKLPFVGPYFHWWHNLMWNRVGEHAMWGTWDYLSEKYHADYAAKNNGVQATGADSMTLDMGAAADARRALGFLTDIDMTKDYNMYSNMLLLAAKWTTAQLRVFGDAMGIKYLGNLGGGERFASGSDLAANVTNDQRISMARHLMLGGLARLAMTSLVVGGLGSTLATGSPSTPVQNFLRDPMHTFDIYTGRDPATNTDRWIHMPIYMFQREFMDWAMAAVRAIRDGKNPVDAALAVPARFFSKANPILRTGIETLYGTEIGKAINGYGDAAVIDNDKSIQNIHKSLDAMGIGLPGWASSLENRLIYAARSASPLGVAFPTNPSTPVSGADLLNAFGVGTYDLTKPQNVAALLGARLDKGLQYETNPITGQEQTVSQSIQSSQARTAQLGQMIDAMKKGDVRTADAIRQQLGLTPGQFKEYITFGATHTIAGDQGIYAAAPQQGVAVNRNAKVTSLFGTDLTVPQQAQYFNMQSQREEQVMQMVMSAPGWGKMSSSEHQALGAQWLSFADKISSEQFGQSIGLRPGTPITNVQANQMITDAVHLEAALSNAITADANYKAASPKQQQTMLAERQAAAKTAVWQAAVGNLKGLTLPQLADMVNTQVGVKDRVVGYVQTLSGYTTAPDIYTAQQYLTKALSWSNLMVADAYANKKSDSSLNAPLKPDQVWGVVKNGLALADAALTMMHKSSVYTEALPAAQTALDNKYETLAHRIVLLDQRQNVDLSQQGALYQQGFGQAIQSRLMADEGYKQLVDTYGGQQAITKSLNEVAQLKKQFAQQAGQPATALSKYNAMIDAWYSQNNPQFGQFMKARAQWELRNPIGQLYVAFNRDELAFAAANDPLAQQLVDQQNQDVAAAVTQAQAGY